MLAAAAGTLALAAMAAAATLEGYAVLPAGSLSPGPLSGQFIEPAPTVPVPFQGQPVQGISALLRDGDGQYLALVDNGYGSRANSPDFVLRIYALEIDFRTARGGSGVVDIGGYIGLHDARQRANQSLVADRAAYPGSSPGIPVADSIREQRWLTGADFDPESLVRDADGRFWVGEEFGPFLLQFDVDGTLLAAPFALRGAVSPDHPRGLPATLPRSRGFEGLAVTPGGERLYAMTEGPLLAGDGTLGIHAFDPGEGRFEATAGAPAYRYRLDPGAQAVGEWLLFAPTRGLVLERDGAEGAAARLKKVYLVDLQHVDAEGVLVKNEVADLLRIHDPHDLDRDGATCFRFPHQTIEALVVLDAHSLLVANDNNYPFGRARDADRPDPTEFILLRLAEPLW